MLKRVLVTGGCGFIGTWVVERLLGAEPGCSITVLDDLSVGSEVNLQEVCEFSICRPDEVPHETGVHLVVGDVGDLETVTACSRGQDCIIHLAARTGVLDSLRNPRGDFRTNAEGTLNVLDAARIHGIGKVVNASSGAAVGSVVPPLHEGIPSRPVSPYGAGKLAGEGYCSAYYHSFGVDTVSLRFSNVYGPRSGNKGSVVAKLIKTALSGGVFEVYGDGQQTRDFIFVSDLVRAVHLAAAAPLGAEVFQIGSGRERTVLELISLVRKALLEVAGIDLKVVHGLVRKGEVMRNYCDPQKARKMLGWAPEITLEDGIRQTVADFIARRGRER